ncbi:MAG: autotransporter-associated beta strand repeat-containing protein, partial [Verrucomicrobia bacterium]|nr:autotransporter-associated beta strand repeat-containing protein [Verrucomicrobiota bacterium]
MNNTTHTALRVAYHRLALLARRGCRAGRPFGKLALTCLLVTYLSAPPLFAASATWNGDTLASDVYWSTLGNWGGAASVPGTGDTATFDNAGNGYTTIDLGGGVTITVLSFDTASAAAYTIGAGAVGSQTLTLDNGGLITNASTVVNNQLINAAVVLGDATASTYTIGNASLSSVLTIAGGISGGTGGAAGLKTLAVTGAGTTILSGIIANGGSLGLGITKDDTGTLTLSGANTFTNGVTLNAGTLNINKWAALGNGGGTFTINGGTLDNTSSTIVFTTNQPISLNGDFAFTGTKNLTLGVGAITLGTAAGASRTITVNGGKLTLGGAIANGTTATNLVKAGSGELILGTVNTFTGAITNNGGTLTIAAGQAVAGGVTLNAGLLNLNSTAGLGVAGSTFTINGGTVDNSSGVTKTLTADNPISIASDFAYTGSQILSVGIAVGTVTLNGAAGARTITVNANTLTLPGVITDGTANSLVKAGNGTLILSGTNNLFTGSVTVNGGTLTISSTNAMAGGVTLNPGATLNINNWFSLGQGANTLTINGGTLDNTSGAARIIQSNAALTVVINADFALAGGSGTTHDLSFGPLASASLGTAAGASRTITVNGNNAGNLGNLTIASIGDGTTATNLIKSGVGLITITNGTYTGGFTLNAGTVNINGATALGNGAGTFTINGGTVANTSPAAVSNANNNPVTINSDFNFSSTRNLDLGTGAGTLGTAAGASRTITTDSATNIITLTLGGAIGNGSTATQLIKAGYGTLTLSGANGFTGGVTLNNGRLNINNAAALGTVAGTFLINGGSINNTSGSAVTLTANQPVTLNSDLTFVGASALDLGSGAVSLGSSAGTSRTLTVNASTLTLGGIISDGTTATSLVKSGPGNLVLSGANTYSGATVVNGGVLQLNGATSLPGGIDTAVGAGESALSLSGGVLGLGAGDFTRALGAGAGQVQFTANGGFAAFTADRNVNLGGASAGVTWNSGSFVPTGSTFVLGATNADKTITFQNPIALNGAARTIQVVDGSAAIDAAITGALTGVGSSGLIKTGAGTLALTANNTFTSNTVVNGGRVILSGASGAFSGTTGVTVTGANSILTLTNGVGASNSDRLNNAVGTTNSLAYGATLNFINDANVNTFTENAAALNLAGGAATIFLDQTAANGTNVLTFTNITRVTNATLLLSGTGLGTNGTTGRNQIIGSSVLTSTFSNYNVGGFASNNGIIPWALIQDGASYFLATGGGTGTNVIRFTNYYTGTTWTNPVSTTNFRPSGTVVIPLGPPNRTNNSLVLDSGVNLDASTPVTNVTLTLVSGLIVQTGGTSSISTNATSNSVIFAFGAKEAVLNIIGTLQIPKLVNTGNFTGTGGVTKTGPGTLQMGSVNTAGPTILNGQVANTGTLNLNQGVYEAFVGANTALNTFIGINFNGGNLTTHATGNINYGVLPLIINADTTLTLDRITQSTGAGTGVSFGLITNNGAGAVFTIAAGASVTSGTQNVTNRDGMTLNAPLTLNLLGNGAGAVALRLTNVTDNGGGYAMTVRGNGNLLQFAGALWTNSGGIILDSNYTGTVTLSEPNAALTGPLTVNSGTLTASGAQGSTAATVNGGILTLSGAQSFTSGVTLNGGLLNLNNATALGTAGSTFTINGGTFNTSAATSNLNNNPLVINGDSTFIGTAVLDLGTGATTLGTSAGTNRTISAVATALTLSGNIANGTTATGLIKQGAGVLALNGANTFTGAVTVNNGTLRLGNNSALGTTAGGITVNSGATLDLTNNTAITGESLTLAGSGMLTSTGGVNIWAGPITVNNSEFNVSTGSDLTLADVVTGPGGVEKTGSGILRVANTGNNYTGTTIVKAGTLIAVSNAPVSANGTFGNSAAAVLLGDSQGTAVAALFANSGATVDRDVTVQTGSTGTKYLGSDGTTGTATFTGAITLNDNLILTNVVGGPLLISGLISGSGKSLTKLGSGSATLTAANTASGTLTVSGGDLILSGVNGSLTPSTIVAGSITVNSSLLGTSLQVTNTAAANKQDRLGGNATPITITTAAGNTATLSVLNDGSANTFRENLGPLTLTGAAGNIVINTTRAIGGVSQLTFASLTGPGAGFALTFNGSGLGETFSVENEISFIAQPSLTGGIIPGATINGTDNATVLFDANANNGAGAYALVISTLYDTNFTQTFPTAQDPTSNAAPFTTTWVSGVNANPYGPVRLLTQRQINSLKLTYGNASAYDAVNYPASLGVVDLNGLNLYLESGTLKASLTNQLIEDRVGGGKLIAGSSAGPAGPTKNLSINVSTNTGGAPGMLTISAVIADNGAFHSNNVIKTGIGTLMFSNVNTYSGDTILTDGTLQLGVSGAIPDGAGKGNVSLTPTAKLDLFGNNETVNGLSGTGIVDNTGGGTSTLTVGGNDIGSTYGGVLQNTSGLLALLKTGVGVFILTNANTFSGAVNVNQGVLSARNSTALGSSSGVAVAAGAQLQIQSSISVTRALTLNGLGTNATTGALRSVSGTNVWSGAVTLGSASRINTDANFMTLSGGINSGGSFVLTLGGAGTTTNLGVIGAGVSAINRDGAGTLALGGANAFTGDINITNGNIRLLASGVIPDGAGVGNVVFTNFSSGVYTNNSRLDLNGFNETINGLWGGFGSNSVVENTVGNVTLTVGANNTTSEYYGAMTNAAAATLNLTKLGTGMFTLGTNFRGTGVITVQDGVLRAIAGNVNALGSAATLQLNGGELQLANDTARAYARNTTVGGNAIITVDRLTAGGGGLTHSLNNLSIGANTLTVQSGTAAIAGATNGLTFGSTVLTGAATFNVLKGVAPVVGTILTLGAVNNGGFNVTFDGTGTNVLSGIISGAGGVIKNGAGLASLTAVNTYGGDTTASAGTLKIGVASAIPNGVGKGNVTVDGTL